MKSFKTIWLVMAALLILGCQFTNTFMSSQPTATPVRARTRTPTATKPPTAPVVVIPSPPPVPTATPEPVLATATGTVNIRATPSTSGAVLGRLNKGETVQIVGRTAASDWWQIILPSNPGALGWVSAQYATPTGSTDAIPIAGPGAPPPGPVAPPTLPAYPPPRPYP